MAAIVPAAVIVIWFVETFYLRTSRRLRILDIETKAPILKHTIETIEGLATVRAFGWQDQCKVTAHAHLELSQRPFYLLMVAQVWLGLALDFVMMGVAVMLMAIGVAKLGDVSAGEMGLALTSTISIGIWMKTLVKFWMNLETSLGAVTRLKAFEQGLRAEDQPGERRIMPVGWPFQGNIQFKGVSASYGYVYDQKKKKIIHWKYLTILLPSSDPFSPLLKDVSFTAWQGQKIAICGRTGRYVLCCPTSYLD